jgi:Family of unknown function (DUF6299)
VRRAGDRRERVVSAHRCGGWRNGLRHDAVGFQRRRHRRDREPGNWNFVTCAYGFVDWSAVPGETYTILAFDSQVDGSGNGGTLTINIENNFDLTLDPVGQFDADTGSATISGTVRCTGNYPEFTAELRQAVGRIATVYGSSWADVTCDGAAHPWSIAIHPYSGKFAGGKATAVVYGSSYPGGQDNEEGTVILRG